MFAEARVGHRPPDCRLCYLVASPVCAPLPEPLERWLSKYPYIEVLMCT